MNTQRFTILFFLISIVEIIADILHHQGLVYLTKPLIMILLMVFYYLQTRSNSNWQDKTVLLAFFFSLMGDIFLMFPGELYFILGLASFLCTHLCLILLFGIKYKVNSLGRLLFLLYALGFLILLKSHLPRPLFLPVLVYAFTIATMGMRAAERQTSPKSYQFVLIGAILFIISDSCIALNKFLTPIPASSFIIMGTYVIAQYLIGMGLLEGRKLQA